VREGIHQRPPIESPIREDVASDRTATQAVETPQRWQLRHVLPEAGHAAAVFLVAVIRLAVDSCFFFALWSAAWLARYFTSRYVLYGWGATFIENMHQGVVVGTYVAVVALVARDAYALWSGPPQNGHKG
jgi:hypothetical protein